MKKNRGYSNKNLPVHQYLILHFQTISLKDALMVKFKHFQDHGTSERNMVNMNIC